MSAKTEKYLILIAIQAVAVFCARNNSSLNPASNETKPFILRVTKIICKGYPTAYFLLHQCRIQLKRNSPPLVVKRATMVKPIESAFLHVTLYYRFSGNYRPLLVDMELDACQYVQSFLTIGNKSDDKFGPFMYQNIVDQMPWKGPCPWPAVSWSTSSIFGLTSSNIRFFVIRLRSSLQTLR